MDADILADRILLDLKNTLKKDPLIDEFDILPVHESHSNTCPVIHIEHKVALEDWCVKHVYVYAYTKFFVWKNQPYKADPDSLLMWTSAILLINPETETVWNARKELVCQNLLPPENELKFCELVLSRKPKSSPVYAHRKWVLLEMQKGCSTPCSLRHTIDLELHLCTRFANLYPNNYYAWCHRSWVVQHMCGMDNKTISDELRRTEKWASVHVSDHCGLHYRQFLLSCLRNSQSHNSTTHSDSFNDDSSMLQINDLAIVHSPAMLFKDALRRELDFLGGLQTMYPGHEALWYHRRYILHSINAENTSVEFKIRSTYGNTQCSNVVPGNAPEFYGNTQCSGSVVHGNAPEFYGNTQGSNVVHGNSAEFYGNSTQCSNVVHGNTAEFYGNTECRNTFGSDGLGLENGDSVPMEGCKRHKLETSINDQEPVDQNKGLAKGAIHCKRHKVEFGTGDSWSSLEEEDFLRQLVLLSRDGEWEKTLVERHVVWAARTLQWRLLLS